MVALSARERHTGLPASLAGDPDAGTALGRLRLRQRITQDQCDAGNRYARLHSAMRRAIKAPNALAVGPGGGCDGDLVTDDYVDWAIRAVASYEVARAWMADARLCSLVEMVVVDDQDCDPELVGYLARGLQILADRMGIATVAT